MVESPIAIARALYAAMEAGHSGRELAHLFTPDARTIEHPNLIKPRGGTMQREAMQSASEAGARLLAKQTYDVHSSLEVGPTAIMRLTWRGTIAQAVGGFQAGQELTAHIAQFIETREGKVASIETFDCYEPFERG